MSCTPSHAIGWRGEPSRVPFPTNLSLSLTPHTLSSPLPLVPPCFSPVEKQTQVHSFDLVSPNPLVTACDMASVPIKDASVHVAVFCLSLMGTNLADFLREAHRVLVPGGLVKVRARTTRMR